MQLRKTECIPISLPRVFSRTQEREMRTLEMAVAGIVAVGAQMLVVGAMFLQH